MLAKDKFQVYHALANLWRNGNEIHTPLAGCKFIIAA
jgi:hypothetical protein